ncbi:MAG: peptidyl-prolyl cis-trans isomerase [Wenzhouxiangellaceae bacterium]|nr:peptidyl-prolyl cis-trans isomerase [Wenzhouxiangellaceae bacterium]
MLDKLLIMMVSALLISGCGDAGDDHRDVVRALMAEDDVVLVEVDGKPVTLPMLEFLMEVRGVEEEDNDEMRELLDELIRLRAVANRAVEENVSTRKRVRAERMVKDIEVQYVRYLEHFQQENPVSDEDIRSVYQAQVERAGDRRYRLETIEFETQADALTRLDSLREESVTFQAALQQADAEGRVARRTDWVDASQVPGDFAEILGETEAGNVVDSLLPYQDQWLVVRVAEIDALNPPALEDVREGIRRTQTRERTQEMIERTYERAEITPMLPVEQAPADGS